MMLRGNYHVLSLNETVIVSDSAAGVAQGCAVYAPEDGIFKGE